MQKPTVGQLQRNSQPRMEGAVLRFQVWRQEVAERSPSTTFTRLPSSPVLLRTKTILLKSSTLLMACTMAGPGTSIYRGGGAFMGRCL